MFLKGSRMLLTFLYLQLDLQLYFLQVFIEFKSMNLFFFNGVTLSQEYLNFYL